MRWWNSSALTDEGRFMLPRLFRRTAALTSSHLAVLAARARHEAASPDEPLVHLFHFGEEYEGAFERWMVEQKAKGGATPVLPKPGDAERESAHASLIGMSITPGEPPPGEGTARALGTIRPEELATGSGRRRAAERLAGAYVASTPGHLVFPYLRLER